MFGCRNACGLADRIDIVEIDDIISYHDVVAAENWGAQAASLLERHAHSRKMHIVKILP